MSMDLDRLSRTINDLHDVVKKTGTKEMLRKVEEVQSAYRDVEDKYKRLQRKVREHEKDD